MVAREKLWLTADRKVAVPDGHPDAAFLLCVPGGHVDDWEADRLGLLGGPLSGNGNGTRTNTDEHGRTRTGAPDEPAQVSGLRVETAAKRSRRGG